MLQILVRANPLTRPGLTFVQSLLFWESAAHHFLALPTILMSLLPIIYMFTEVCCTALGRAQSQPQRPPHKAHGLARCATASAIQCGLDQRCCSMTPTADASGTPTGCVRCKLHQSYTPSSVCSLQ